MRDFIFSFIGGIVGAVIVTHGRSTYRWIKNWLRTRKLVKRIRSLIGDHDLHA